MTIKNIIAIKGCIFMKTKESCITRPILELIDKARVFCVANIVNMGQGCGASPINI